MLRKFFSFLSRLFSRRRKRNDPPPPPSGGLGQTVSEEEVRKRLEGLGYIE